MRSPATVEASPRRVTPGDLGRDHLSNDAQGQIVAADLHRGQGRSDLHPRSAPVDILPPTDGCTPPKAVSSGVDINGDQLSSGLQEVSVAESEGNGQTSVVTQGNGADPSDALLLILADSLNDVEALRKATANQLHSLTRERDGKGGKGLSPHGRAAVMLADRLAVLEQFEHSTILELQRTLRQHRFGPWVKRTVGIGEKQGARLIAAIGDPAWNRAEDRPRRGPAELWAYCGYAPGQKRRKGVRSNWNAEAKMRAYLCAESCIKQTGMNSDAKVGSNSICATRRRSPYRDVYDRARENWAGRETSDGHKHAHALRCVAKAILKDLWREASTNSYATSMRPPSGLASQGDDA